MSYLGQEILSTPWHLASSSSSSDLRSLPPPNASSINPRARAPDPGRRRRFEHTHTHIGSSETAGLRKWTLHGGKSSLARQARLRQQPPNLQPPQLSSTHSPIRSSCGGLPTAPTRHSRSDTRHSLSFTPSQASFPQLRSKTPIEHVLCEPARHSTRHLL